MSSFTDIITGRNITRLRRSVGLSLGNLALQLVIPDDRLAAFEYGEARVPPNLLLRLAGCLGVSISDFFEPVAMEGFGLPLCPMGANRHQTIH